jgi:RimJ/RimL family protein N-acetyltransferase
MQTETPEIVTARLILIPVTRSSVLIEQAANGNYNSFGEAIGCSIHPQWPPIHWEPHVFDFFLKIFDEHPEQDGWSRYVALPQHDGSRQLIGTLGAFSKDSADDAVEIGYGILPSCEGNGYATEGTLAIIDLLRRQGVASIIAHTLPSLSKSIRVMEKCGLLPDGEGDEQGTVRYRLNLR